MFSKYKCLQRVGMFSFITHMDQDKTHIEVTENNRRLSKVRFDFLPRLESQMSSQTFMKAIICFVSNTFSTAALNVGRINRNNMIAYIEH